MADRLIGLDDVQRAVETLRGRILRTPLVRLGASELLLKAENLQPGGSFKLRGALLSMLELGPDRRSLGVVAHSSGNHAIAVALAGRMLGVPATVVMPDDAPDVKLRSARALGAEVLVVGPDSLERAERARAIARRDGRALIEPYDSWAVLAATATIGIEIVEDLGPDPDAVVFVPVSGGGLAGGVAAAVKLLSPRSQVIGVEPELAADALASWRAGHPVTLPAEQMARTSADGLRVRRVGDRCWSHLREHLDDIVTVSEAQMFGMMRRLALEARLVAEPSGAVAAAAAAALLRVDARGPSRPAVAVVSGGNGEPELLGRVLAGGSLDEEAGSAST